MKDTSPPDIAELINIGAVNKLYWITTNKNGRATIQFRIPEYLDNAFTRIKETINFPVTKTHAANFNENLVSHELYDQMQLYNALLQTNGHGFRQERHSTESNDSYSILTSQLGLLGKSEFYVSVAPPMFAALKDSLNTWKESAVRKINLRSHGPQLRTTLKWINSSFLTHFLSLL